MIWFNENYYKLVKMSIWKRHYSFYLQKIYLASFSHDFSSHGRAGIYACCDVPKLNQIRACGIMKLYIEWLCIALTMYLLNVKRNFLISPNTWHLKI